MAPYNVKNATTTAASSQAGYADSFMEAFARLKDATGARTDTELAHCLGLKQSSISSAKSKRELPPAWVVAIAMRYNVSTDWLLFGVGDKTLDPPTPNACPHGSVPASSPPFPGDTAAQPQGYTLVPKVLARLAADTGVLETEADRVQRYAFRTEFLRRKGCPGNMVLMDIAGDNMAPLLLNRDMVLIDVSQNAVITGGIFAVGIDQEVHVAILDKLPGKLILRNGNPQCHPIELDLNSRQADSIRVVGRVVWSCREHVR